MFVATVPAYVEWYWHVHIKIKYKTEWIGTTNYIEHQHVQWVWTLVCSYVLSYAYRIYGVVIRAILVLLMLLTKYHLQVDCE